MLLEECLMLRVNNWEKSYVFMAAERTNIQLIISVVAYTQYLNDKQPSLNQNKIKHLAIPSV